MHALVSALPLTHMKCLPLNNCSLSNESYTAFGNKNSLHCRGAVCGLAECYERSIFQNRETLEARGFLENAQKHVPFGDCPCPDWGWETCVQNMCLVQSLPAHIITVLFLSVLAVPYLRSVDLSWCKVVEGRLSLLLDALQPSVLQELRLSSCELTTEDIKHMGK